MRIKKVLLNDQETVKFIRRANRLHSMCFTGKNGEYTLNFNQFCTHDMIWKLLNQLKLNKNEIFFDIKRDDLNKMNWRIRSMIGTILSYISNSVQSIRQNFECSLSLLGNGYVVQTDEQNNLILNIGLSHMVLVHKLFKEVNWTVKNNIITFFGKNKMLVNQAREIVYRLKPLNSYKPKGFRKNEQPMVFKERTMVNKSKE